MNRIDHPDFFDVDLPALEAEFGDDGKFTEFLTLLDKAVFEVMKDPANEGASLTRAPLAEYRKKKFHSMLRPPKGLSADMRLVYRCDRAQNTLYVLGVGHRHRFQSNDIYARLNTRSPI